MAITIAQKLNALRWPMKEKGLETLWNELKGIMSAAIGGNVTITAGRTTLGQLDLTDVNDLALTVTDAGGRQFGPPIFPYPDPGADRNREAIPQLGGFRF